MPFQGAPEPALSRSHYTASENDDIKPTDIRFFRSRRGFMKLTLQKASHIFLIAGLMMLAISYVAYDFENLVLNLLTYAILSIGFALNFIAVLKNRK
jgi:hypothetical protein